MSGCNSGRRNLKKKKKKNDQPTNTRCFSIFFWKRALGGLTAWGPIHQRGLKYHTRASKNNNRILVSLLDPILTLGIIFFHSRRIRILTRDHTARIIPLPTRFAQTHSRPHRPTLLIQTRTRPARTLQPIRSTARPVFRRLILWTVCRGAGTVFGVVADIVNGRTAGGVGGRVLARGGTACRVGRVADGARGEFTRF